MARSLRPLIGARNWEVWWGWGAARFWVSSGTLEQCLQRAAKRNGQHEPWSRGVYSMEHGPVFYVRQRGA